MAPFPLLPISAAVGAILSIGYFSVQHFSKPTWEPPLLKPQLPTQKPPLEKKKKKPIFSEKLIILRSSDGETFQVTEAAASLSLTIKNMIEAVSSDQVIPLPNLTGKTLSKVIEYCEMHVHDPPSSTMDFLLDEEVRTFDANFIDVDQPTLYNLVMAANYLDIKGLMSLTCQSIADMIKGKTPGQIREELNIPYDFTPEEEEEIRNENIWRFE